MNYQTASATTQAYRKANPDLDSTDISPIAGVSGRNTKQVEIEFVEQDFLKFPWVEIPQFRTITKVEINAPSTLQGNFIIKVGSFVIYNGPINAGLTLGSSVTLDHANGELSIFCDQKITGNFILTIQSI